MKTTTILKKHDITKNQVSQAVQDSRSYREVLLTLKWNEAGGAYRRVKRLISDFKLDISHFRGKGWNGGNIHVPTSDYLSNKKYIKASHLKKRLIKEGIKEHKCEQCFNETWNNQPIPLELHHKDGDRYNNNLSNVILLCCNCHAQTDTWRNKST